MYVQQHPQCEDCLEAGIIGVAAAEVHHMIKVRDRRDLRLDFANS
jgi:hypothetical protein